MTKLRKVRDYGVLFNVQKNKLPKPEQIGVKPEDHWGTTLDIRFTDCSDFDLSQYDPQFIDFNDGTVFPSDPAKMPANFNPAEIMERGKDSGLGIRALHEHGITGKGIVVAIIDQQLSPHQEYNDNLVHYEEFGYDWSKNPYGSTHGPAVASLFVGKTCGAAPDAKLYYFAADNLVRAKDGNRICDENGQDKKTAKHTINALKRILEINKTLPPKDRIQVVSISWGGQSLPTTEGYKEWNTLVQEAAAQGVFVCSCNTVDKETQQAFFFGSSRKVNGNPNTPIDYIIPKDTEHQKDLLFPRNHRTVASVLGENRYDHYSEGGESWRTPCSAGLFALARQVNPTITPEQFYKLGRRTGLQTPYGTLILPKRLFDQLEWERTKTNLSLLLKRRKEGRQYQ